MDVRTSRVSGRGHTQNNLDFLRLLFAVAVIYSHSYPLVTGRVDDEPLWLLSHHRTTLGGLAVAFFFVVSGFLITGSYLASRSLGGYFAKRSLRIFPAYFIAAFISIAVAPLVATAINHRYLADLAIKALVMDPLQSRHIFLSNPFPASLNGALWTIKYEIGCYLLLALAGQMGLLRRPPAMLGLFVAVSVLSLISRSSSHATHMYFLVGQLSSWLRFFREFLIGVNFYLWRERVVVNFWYAALAADAIVLSIYLRPLELGVIVMEVAAAYIIFALAFAKWLPAHRFGRFGDFSYGTYLYGWLVQQLLVWYAGPRLTPLWLFAAAVPISVGLAFGSWHLVEHPALRLKDRLKPISPDN
jgi:peptidoglycan/LPS O-acetylase OafA/YrhL